MVHRHHGSFISLALVTAACSSGAREPGIGSSSGDDALTDEASSGCTAPTSPTGEGEAGSSSEATTQAEPAPACGPSIGKGGLLDAIGFTNPGDQRFSSLALGPNGVLTAVADVDVSNECELLLDSKSVPLFLGGALDYPGGRRSEIAVAQYDTSVPYGEGFLTGGVIGGVGFQRAAGVAVDGAGTIYVAGVFNGNLYLPNKLGVVEGVTQMSGPTAVVDAPEEVHSFVAAYRPTGELLWHTQIGGAQGSGAWIEAIAVNSSGELALVGAAHGEIPAGLGEACQLGDSWGPFVAKLPGGIVPPAGPLWVLCPDSDGEASRAYGVDVDEAGGVVATGFFRGSLAWRDVQGEVVPGGGVTAAGAQDLFVARWDAGGALQWHERCGSARVQSASDEDAGHAVLAMADGRVLVAGAIGEAASCVQDGSEVYSRRSTGLLAARGPAGWAWEQIVQLDPQEPETGAAWTALAQDTGGSIVVTGSARGPVSFVGQLRGARGAVDALVAKLSCEGALTWFHRFGVDDGGGAALKTVFTDVVLAGDALHVAGAYEASFHSNLEKPQSCHGDSTEAMLINLSP